MMRVVWEGLRDHRAGERRIWWVRSSMFNGLLRSGRRVIEWENSVSLNKLECFKEMNSREGLVRFSWGDLMGWV